MASSRGIDIDLETHVAHEHNPEHYIFLRIYLAEKDPNEYTGQEQYVQQCIRAKTIKFFPLKKASCLDIKDDSISEIAELRSRMDNLEDLMVSSNRETETHTKLLETLLDELKDVKRGLGGGGFEGMVSPDVSKGFMGMGRGNAPRTASMAEDPQVSTSHLAAEFADASFRNLVKGESRVQFS